MYSSRAKRILMKTIAFLSVPILGVSAFIGYWVIDDRNIGGEKPPAPTVKPEEGIPSDDFLPSDGTDYPDQGVNPEDKPVYDNINIKPINKKDLYPYITSEGKFNEQFIHSFLKKKFPSMIDWKQIDTNPNSTYSLYYELKDENILNILVNEEINGAIINQTKFTYEIENVI